ncbi:MAG: preprotein translocase subunit SecG [Burkholderiaceae bacterium]|nr:preprotein translocase subunit SecG [Burkholderiaceae bacterium]
MQVWLTLILVVQLLAALVMIGLVLIQHGKGADMGASFGGGASGSLFGATGSANFLSRSTAACATVFFIATLALAYLGSTGAQRAEGGSTVLDQLAPAASAPGAIPGAVPGVVPGTIPAGTGDTPAGMAPAASAPAGQIPK